MLPPIWQVPSAARLKGKSRFTAAAASCTDFERCARVRRERVAGRIDGADRLHALQAQHEFGAGFERRLPADEAGVAALRHDGDALLVGELEDGADLRR